MLRAHLTHAVRQRRDDTFAIRNPTRVRAQRIILGEITKAQSVCARAPLSVAPDSNDERSVRRLKKLIRNEIGVRVSPSFCIATRYKNVLRYVHQRRASAVCQRDVDAPFFGGEFSFCTLYDRRKNGDSCILAAEHIGESDTNLHRRAIALAGDGHPAALGLDDEVIAWPRAIASESGDRAPDERRMLHEQLLGIKPKSLERTGQEIVEDYIGSPDEVQDHLPILRVGQVQGDALFVPVDRKEVG